MKTMLSGRRRVAKRAESPAAVPTSGFRFNRQALKSEEGTDLIEYAIMFLLLMTLLFGIAGFGHALYAYHFVSNMAREATRWAAVNGSTCATDNSCAAPATSTDVTTFVTNHIPPGIDPTQITVTPTWNPAGSNGPLICGKTPNAPGCTIEVQVSYNFSFVFPLIRTTALPMSSTSELVIAH